MIKKTVTNTISDIFEKIASKEFNPKIQSLINNGYVSILGLNMDEFKQPNEYNSLNALFTRKLEKERYIDKDVDTIIAPTDSLVTEFGKLDNNVSMQIKGMKYFVDDLLTEHSSHIDKVIDGTFINFYLSPKDYHRYHSPLDLKVNRLIHVPGKLYPVNMRYLNNKLNLFIENERVILEGVTKNSEIVYLVFVGALNVGKMRFDFEPQIETNSDTREIKIYDYNDVNLSKGDEIGYFMMGSTVLLIAQKDFLNTSVELNQKVKFGEVVANIKKG